MKKVIRFLAYICIIAAIILVLGTSESNTITEAVAWFRFIIIIILIGFGLLGLGCTVENDTYDY